MGDSPDLSDRQAHIISLLPASASELAAELGIGNSTVRDHIGEIRKKGVELKNDDDGLYHLVDEEKVRRVSTKHTGTKTREANNFATEMEAAILRRLKPKEPLTATQDPSPGNEDVVLHLTDTHMGDVVENQHGREVFNPEICEAYIEHVTQKTIDLCELMGELTDFDTCHVVWGGDMLTNENIYDGQAFDIGLMLKDQMARTVDALTQQAETLADYFDTVQIIAQPGNHGKTRASGVSKQANMDLILYRWIQDRVSDRGIDNVNYLTAEATWYRTFELRDGAWTGMARHGQDSMEHVDATSRSESDWRGWKIAHGYDIAYRGHYHEARREPVMGKWDVIESPSMKPGDDFAERIGEPEVDPGGTQRLATLHGVGDERPKTWEFVLDDAEMDMGQYVGLE